MYLDITHDETSVVENIRRSIQNIPKGQRVILHIIHTTSTTCQPTNLCISSVCQRQGQYPERMFPTDQESQQHKHTNIHSSKCLDNNFTYHSSNFRNYTHLHLEKHLDLSHHRHPSKYFDYSQHAVPHHSIFIYHHAMNPMKSLSTSH